MKGAKLDGYVVWKDARTKAAPGNVRVNNGAPFPPPSDWGELLTLGGRAEVVPATGWELRAEGAAQRDRRNGRDLRAFGFTGRLARRFGRGRKHRAHLGFEHLSGDDPASGRDESFDAHVSAHLHAEYFRPGDFYAAHRRDESSFVRAELNLAF